MGWTHSVQPAVCQPQGRPLLVGPGFLSDAFRPTCAVQGQRRQAQFKMKRMSPVKPVWMSWAEELALFSASSETVFLIVNIRHFISTHARRVVMATPTCPLHSLRWTLLPGSPGSGWLVWGPASTRWHTRGQTGRQRDAWRTCGHADPQGTWPYLVFKLATFTQFCSFRR